MPNSFIVFRAGNTILSAQLDIVVVYTTPNVAFPSDEYRDYEA